MNIPKETVTIHLIDKEQQKFAEYITKQQQKEKSLSDETIEQWAERMSKVFATYND